MHVAMDQVLDVEKGSDDGVIGAVEVVGVEDSCSRTVVVTMM